MSNINIKCNAAFVNSSKGIPIESKKEFLLNLKGIPIQIANGTYVNNMTITQIPFF
jgi:hypothetical protein